MVIDYEYGKKIKKKALTHFVEDFIKEVSPELDEIYDAVLKGIRPLTITTAPDEKKREEALKYFKENNEKFKYISRRYLMGKSLYAFSGGQERRDFEGRLLEKMCDDYGLGEFSERYLYELKTKIDQ